LLNDNPKREITGHTVQSTPKLPPPVDAGNCAGGGGVSGCAVDRDVFGELRAAREHLKRSRRSGMACRIHHGFDWS
jgi:hypothetical protein